jgi:hypothetical protein
MSDDVFKFRAECVRDVGNVLLRVNARKIEIESTEHAGDVVTTITGATIGAGKALDVASFKAVLAEIADGHVMVETLALADEYTGERTCEPTAAEIAAAELAAKGLVEA